MIGDILNYIRLEIRDRLGLQDNAVTLGHLHSRARSERHDIRIALVNVAEESTPRVAPQDLRNRAAQAAANMPTSLQLHIAIAFDPEDYQAGLNLLSNTHDLFHATPVFDKAMQRTDNPLPVSVQRLLFEMQNCENAELAEFWRVNGGDLLPSLLYRVRVVRASAL